MRTLGLGEIRLSSTSGVLPMAWTMSPYLPPQGRVSRSGAPIASESVVPVEGGSVTCDPEGVLPSTGRAYFFGAAQNLCPSTVTSR